MLPSPRHDRTLVVLHGLLLISIILTVLAFLVAPPSPDSPGKPSLTGIPADVSSDSCLITGPVATSVGTSSPVHVKILAINDFHGQISIGKIVGGRAVGSAPVIAAYLKNAAQVFGPGRTIIALPGDVVGASSPESGLLADEPTLLFFNGLANPCCTVGNGQSDTACNMVATPGNHEFDRGTGELMRQIYGGNGTTLVTHITDPYPGSRSSYTCSNVIWKENSTLLFPPYVIRDVGGVRIAFIGADTVSTPERLKSHMADDITFLNESASINRYVLEIQRKGIHAIVVLLHEGGDQPAYVGETRAGTNVTGRVTGIVAGLDGDVDVVLSGHTHTFTNAYLPNSAGNPVLVTQSYSYSEGFADVDLTLDPASGDIVNKSAHIVIAYADQPPGSSPDPETTAFLTKVTDVVSPIVNRHIAVIAQDILKNQNAAGESALGDLIADSERGAMKTDIAFLSSGSLRDDLLKGDALWGDLYSIQPFSGTVVSMNLTGRQVQRVLERQWQDPLPPHNLGISGLTYSFDSTKPVGSRVYNLSAGGKLLDPNANYTAAMTDYLSTGGDGYTEFTHGTMIQNGPLDLDALISYLESLPQPVNVTSDGRVQRTG